MRPEDVIERQVAAFNAHDLEAFLATYAEDAVVDGVEGADGPIRGREAMRRHYAKRLAQPGLRAEIAQRVRMGRWVIDYEIVENDAGRVEAIAVYEVEERLIRRTTLVREPQR